MTGTGILVVGNGPVAHRFVERLRHHGRTDRVTVLDAADSPACHRPLLTSVLDGSLPATAVTLAPPPGDTLLAAGTRAVRIDRARRLVHTEHGDAHRYDRLVLATGATPHVPDLPGLRGPDGRPAPGVSTLRTLADAVRPRGERVTVLGGGVLGVEAALALRRAGHLVTLVHRHAWPLNRRLDRAAGELLAARLAAAGVELRLSTTATGYSPGRLALTRPDGGRGAVEGDALLLCTGAEPATALARAAGLPVRAGVLVDADTRTGDPRVHAIGDCAEHPDEPPGTLRSGWAQAETAARLLATGTARHRPSRPVLRPRTPGLDLAVLGEPEPATPPDETIQLTDAARGRYARLHLTGGRLTGAVLLGWERAIADLVQLHQRDLPVPRDRLALLLGRPTRPATGPVELPDHAVVCHCNNVTAGTLAHAWHAGARSTPELAAATRATTGCGGCARGVEALRAVLAARADTTAPTRQPAGSGR